jgi:hypothetical protein
MNFPGSNELKLTSDAVRLAVEGALNSARKDGEDYIHVLSVSTSYSYGPFVATITTDAPVAEPVTTLQQVAA